MSTFTPRDTTPRVGWSPTRRVIWHELQVYRRIWRGSVAANFVFPVFYLAAMGIGIGHLVNRHVGHVGGHPYVAYIGPGLLAMTAMQSGAAECMWPVVDGIKWSKVFCAITATPVEPEDIVTGRLVWTAIRLFVTSLVYVGIFAVFGVLTSWWSLLLPFIGALTALAFAAPLFAYATTLDNDYVFTVVQRFLFVPLFLFSATFYPLSTYPHWLRPLVQVSPLYHSVALCRAAAFGTGRPLALVMHTVILLTMTIIGTVLSRRYLRKCLTV